MSFAWTASHGLCATLYSCDSLSISLNKQEILFLRWYVTVCGYLDSLQPSQFVLTVITCHNCLCCLGCLYILQLFLRSRYFLKVCYCLNRPWCVPYRSLFLEYMFFFIFHLKNFWVHCIMQIWLKLDGVSPLIEAPPPLKLHQ